ncbi:MAG: cytochrome c family protein [Syntrophorhabdaceae bacterium]|nr:cytochrome c family protein [Syntrophorhabdaceae bacterium]
MDRENQQGTFTTLYRLVRAFLSDFYRESKEGTKRHIKGVTIFLSFVLFCFIVIAVSAYKISEMPFFCGVCHNMKAYVDSWKNSHHKNVSCIACHYKPGFINHLKGKWKDGQVSLVYFITGKKITKPHAEIDDASCLQSGCHSKDSLKDPIIFKNVVFNHLPHLEQMRRAKQLRCTTCHSQIVQGAHITVTDVECFICHFYKTKDQKEFLTGCTSCHYEAKGNITVSGFTFNHKRYIKRGIKCETCHTAVVSGDGHLPEFVCLQCHNKREIVEAKYTPEQLHKNHVTDHKVECFNCHSSIKHEIKRLNDRNIRAGECSTCHKEGTHNEKLLMYLGKGAKFVKDTPNLMARLNMDCTSCHKHDNDKTALSKRCNNCHGDLTEGMVERWKRMINTKMETLLKEINTARELSKNVSLNVEAKKRLEDAIFNYNYLKNGNPVHNIIYSLEIADKTIMALGDLKSKATGTTSKPKEKESSLNCTNICHGNIFDKKVPFGKANFSHEIHAEGEGSCTKCHTPYTNHGNTIKKGCGECHHGKGEGNLSCKDCHEVENAMLKAKGSFHVKLSCEECHSNVKLGKKETEGSIKRNCVRCHKREYASKVDDWIKKDQKVIEEIKKEALKIEKEIEEIEAKEGRHSVPLRTILDEITQDTNSLTRGKYWHNPTLNDSLIEKTKGNIEKLRGMLKTKREGKAIRLK